MDVRMFTFLGTTYRAEAYSVLKRYGKGRRENKVFIYNMAGEVLAKVRFRWSLRRIIRWWMDTRREDYAEQDA